MLPDNQTKVNTSNVLSLEKKKKSKQIKDNSKQPPNGLWKYDEDASPELNFAKSLLSENAYCSGNASLYHWNNWYWKHTDDIQKEWDRRKAVQFLGLHAPDRVASSVVNSAVAVAKFALPPLPKAPRDAGATVIPLIGTWLQVQEDGSIVYKSPDRNMGVTYALKVSKSAGVGEYVPKALPEGSMFKAYLDAFMPNKDWQKVLQEFAGYSLTPSTKYHKSLMLQGEGGEGKSVFIEIMSGIHHKVEVFDVNNTEPRKPTSLADATLLVCPEVGKKNFQLEFFKAVAAGDPVNLRSLYKDEISTVIGAKVIFSFNNFPLITDKTNGFWRRVILMRMTHKIAPDKINLDLAKDILKNEAALVLDWALEGLQRLTQQKDFTKVPELESSVAEWKTSQNTVSQFTDEFELETHPTQYRTKVELFQLYQKYCKDRGHMPVSNESFYADLKRSFPRLEEKKISLKGERPRVVFCTLKALRVS